MTIYAWHGNPDLKAEVLARMLVHREQDSIIQGLYQERAPELATGYKGCLIGCTLPKRDYADTYLTNRRWHDEVEFLYGIPRSVGILLDNIFEELPEGTHAEFAVASIETIPVGADLSMVKSRMILDVLVDTEFGMLQLASSEPEHLAVMAVAELFRRHLNNDEPSTEEWEKAKLEAHSADDATTGIRPAYIAALASGPSYGSAICMASGVANRRDTWPSWASERMLQHLREAS